MARLASGAWRLGLFAAQLEIEKDDLFHWIRPGFPTGQSLSNGNDAGFLIVFASLQTNQRSEGEGLRKGVSGDQIDNLPLLAGIDRGIERGGRRFILGFLNDLCFR